MRARMNRVLAHAPALTDELVPLLSQAMPVQYARIRGGSRTAQPRALVIDHVCDVLRAYRRACGVIAAGEENHTP